MLNIQNKVIAITGASSGIGEATARFLAAKGAKVVLGARRIENLRSRLRFKLLVERFALQLWTLPKKNNWSSFSSLHRHNSGALMFWSVMRD
jgi:NAD(P)-dependent dehydrogenase (short-subunit alcohol dehydrogenase family)